jgi:Protein of unknown function (DUF3752)
MPSVGPTLSQAQAEKRKREPNDGDDEAASPPSRSPNPRLASQSSSAKRARVIGPSLPPASLDERPPQPPDSDATSSSGDDDFGPSLPTSTSQLPGASTDGPLTVPATGAEASAPKKSQRDEWMIVPPTSGDWSSRIDPTKLKNRKFNAGKGAKGPAQTSGEESNANWTETLDDKRARLRREILGLKDVSTTRDSPEDDGKARENAKKLREYNVSRVPASFFCTMQN